MLKVMEAGNITGGPGRSWDFAVGSSRWLARTLPLRHPNRQTRTQQSNPSDDIASFLNLNRMTLRIIESAQIWSVSASPHIGDFGFDLSSLRPLSDEHFMEPLVRAAHTLSGRQ